MVKWHTDDYTSSIIAKSGSKKRELLELAIEIFNNTFNHNIRFDDCNGTRTHNHLVCKQTLNHLAKLIK